MSQLLAEGWILQNEIGDELDFAQAEEIRRQIAFFGRDKMGKCRYKFGKFESAVTKWGIP